MAGAGTVAAVGFMADFRGGAASLRREVSRGRVDMGIGLGMAVGV
jgi:hypothetical protein